jgi:glycerol-3-phosphate acyltransferase PlsY
MPGVWEISWPYLLEAFVFGYLLGSIPFGIVLTKIAGTQDLRQIGSGNIGATNVLRTGRKGLAAATLAGDLLKGTAAVLLAGKYGPDPMIFAGLGAFLGHLFPLWLKFRGGKGVATYLGILGGFSLPGAAVFAVIWLATAVITRYSSLSALLSTLAIPVFLHFNGQIQVSQLFGLLTILVYIKHRSNIIRLVSGKESKIGSKK